MHQYNCPNCKTVLKRAQPVPAGKKIKCPKCEKIFAPPAVAMAAAKPASAPKKDDDEDFKNPYLVREEEEEEDTVKAEKQRAAAGIVKDRFKKSKRGPAQAKINGPAGWMTAAGVVWGIIYIIMFFVGIFPLVFRSYYLDTPEFRELDAAGQQAYWENLVLVRCILIGGSILGFIYASLVCIGAFKMRTLESYGWAMTGAILTILLGGIWMVIGIWALITLRDKDVIEGFAEEPPPPI